MVIVFLKDKRAGSQLEVGTQFLFCALVNPPLKTRGAIWTIQLFYESVRESNCKNIHIYHLKVINFLKYREYHGNANCFQKHW